MSIILHEAHMSDRPNDSTGMYRLGRVARDVVELLRNCCACNRDFR
jgi:hypothetical protein